MKYDIEELHKLCSELEVLIDNLEDVIFDSSQKGAARKEFESRTLTKANEVALGLLQDFAPRLAADILFMNGPGIKLSLANIEPVIKGLTVVVYPDDTELPYILNRIHRLQEADGNEKSKH